MSIGELKEWHVFHVQDCNLTQFQDYLGWGLWAVGLVFEVVADYQKSVFRNDPANQVWILGLWVLFCAHNLIENAVHGRCVL